MRRQSASRHAGTVRTEEAVGAAEVPSKGEIDDLMVVLKASLAAGDRESAERNAARRDAARQAS